MKPQYYPMITLRRLRSTTGLLLCSGIPLLLAPAAHANAAGDITAVSSRVSKDYVRTKLATGSFQAETYAFGEGGHLSGPMQDDTIDRLHFTDVARTIARPLAGQNYLRAKDPTKTKLLIMIYWGTTTVPRDNPGWFIPSNDGSDMLLFNQQRDLTDFRNAQMLGYDSTGGIGTDYGRHLLGTALHSRTEDLLDEIDDHRYFVVLLAYDFQLLWTQQKQKLLWETRFSIRERQNDFGEVLPDIAQYASKYFGQDSHGLLRKPLPEGHVTLGKLDVGEVVPEK